MIEAGHGVMLITRLHFRQGMRRIYASPRKSFLHLRLHAFIHLDQRWPGAAPIQSDVESNTEGVAFERGEGRNRTIPALFTGGK